MKRGKRQFKFWATFQQTLRTERRVLLTSLGFAGCVIGLRLTGFLQAWELSALDFAFRLRPLEPVDERIVIVGIDEPDLQWAGQWPISDLTLAKLLTTIQSYNPRAIGLDLYRDLPVNPGHADLQATYRSIPNLVGIQQLKDKTSPGVPAPAGLDPATQIGFNNLVFDPDNKVRRSLLYWTMDGKRHRSLALVLSLIYLEQVGIKPQAAAQNSRYLQLGKGVFPIFAPNDGAYTDADAGGYQTIANPRGPAQRFEMVSMTAVLQGQVPAEQLRDRIVLIGSTAMSLKDFFYNSYSGKWVGSASPAPLSGVELQANFISQILSAAIEGRPLIQVWAEPGEWLWILFWSWIGAFLCWRIRSPRIAALAILVAGSGLASICYLAFLIGWWLPLVPPSMAMAGAAIGIIAHLAHLEGELKRSKEFLNTIINTIPDPIFVKDRQHRWIVLNQAFCRFLGYPLEFLLEKTDYDVFPLEEAAVFRQQDQRVFNSGQEHESEESFTDNQGATHMIETKRSLHQDAAGNLFLVGVIRDITERKQLEEELKRTAAELVRSNAELQKSAHRLNHEANHDSLTGLPNRKLFHERLTQSLEWATQNHQLVALLFLDLDGFKQINDRLGHAIGDALLKGVAARLTGCLRGSDTVARLGGDEFTVILPAIPTVQDAGRVADKILATLSQPFSLNGHTVQVTTSIGISVFPQDGQEADIMLKSADAAMYQAKDSGKSCYYFVSLAEPG